MPARRYPALRVCFVTWPLRPRRLRVAGLSAPVGLSGAGLRRSGGGRTLINGSTIVWGDPQPMCSTHQARSTCGPDHSGTTSPAGTAAAVLAYAQDARRLDRRDWQHQLGRLRVSEDLLPLEGRPPLLGIALLTSCGTSMRCRAPARAAISFRKVVSNNSPSTIFGRGRRRSAHLSPRRGNKQNAVRSAGTGERQHASICRGHKPIASVVRRSPRAALPAVYGATYLAFLRFPTESCAEKLYAIGYVSL